MPFHESFSDVDPVGVEGGWITASCFVGNACHRFEQNNSATCAGFVPSVSYLETLDGSESFVFQIESTTIFSHSLNSFETERISILSTLSPNTAPFGTWGSPISAALVGSGNHVFELKLDGDDVYFVEVRPKEAKARYSLMRVKARGGGEASEVVHSPFNVRSMVHEYGGGGFVVTENDKTVFSNFEDQKLYATVGGTSVLPLTRGEIDCRYADGVFDSQRNRIVCVRELHPERGKREAVNSIVAIDLKTGNQSMLLSGNDFYAFPRASSDGKKLAWITWNFPNMPFDGSELWIGEFDADGIVVNKSKLAGGLDESVTQPVWSDSGELFFISDRTGWWNLYRWNASEGISALCQRDSDFCQPDWNLGLSTFGVSKGKIVCTFSDVGDWKLAIIDLSSSRLEKIDSDLVDISHIHVSKDGFAIFLAASRQVGHAIYRLDIASKKIEKIYESPADENNEECNQMCSIAVPVSFPTANNLQSHGFFYEPRNTKYSGPKGELPPLIVMVHGGPTHASTSALRGTVQFFTSRGFAVLDVNYGGSSSFGREYRRRLNGQWGVVDVEDCVNGALYLAREGRVDKNRVVIRGGSAGGWTTLCALAFRSDFFRAGACYYGISDLERWELDCHKFESQYLHSLIGSYPQERDLYLERSPTNHASKVSAPLILFQGLEDRVVPPSQSELMVNGLKKSGRSAQFVPFEGEQHDFRQANHIQESLEKELAFFKKALKID